MAIDAVIDEVVHEGANLRLILRPRIDRDDQDTLTGQEFLVILDYTHVPLAGQHIWGGSDTVIIEPKLGIDRRWVYIRQGYTKLVERYHENDDHSGRVLMGIA